MQPHPVEVLATLVRDARRLVDGVQAELDSAKVALTQAEMEYRTYVSKMAGIAV